MSNAKAIAAVTATLRQVLLDAANRELAGSTVTSKPLDKARPDSTADQINLFLYLTEPNNGWSNLDHPVQAQPGESGRPPLALNLNYVITAYGADDDEVTAHRLLGAAMRAFHDYEVLSPADIDIALPGSDLDHQVERVRLSRLHLPLDEMSRLWTTSQTQFRLSAAYQATVILIESERPSIAPVPVLSRGIGDSGPVVQASLDAGIPVVTAVTPPKQEPAALPGETVTVAGLNLAATTVTVVLSHPLLATPLQVTPTSATPTGLTFTVPNQPADAPAGIWALTILLQDPGAADRTTSAVPLPIAPSISSALPSGLTRDASGTVTLAFDCAPDVLPGQRASLLIGAAAGNAPAVTAATGHFSITVPSAPVGPEIVRLRVDGVDSRFVDRTATPPTILPSAQVVVT